MGGRDAWLLTSTLMAGCVLLGPDPARAGEIQSPPAPIPSAKTQHMETCAAIKQRYADLARQLATQARQIASAADDAERLVPAQYIPTRRWQSDYDRALELNDQSLQISRLGDAAFESCAETTVSAQRQPPSTPGRAISGADTSSRRRARLAPVEAP
jgi:hypothetical protein